MRSNDSGLIKSLLKNASDEKEAVEEKIANSAFRPTESEAEIVKDITVHISNMFRDDISNNGISGETKSRIEEAITKYIAELPLDYETQKRVERVAINNIVGLGPLELYMHDSTISDIIVQRWDNICIERNGVVEPVSATFDSEEHLVNVINRIIQPVGKEINLHTTWVDARLHDGSRVNATIPPTSPDGATLSLRLFPEKELSPSDYISLRSMSRDMLRFMADCIRAKITVIVSGGTTSGKTSLLNMFSSFIPENELIVTIEDSCELRLRQKNVRRLEARSIVSEGMTPVTIETLVKNALRMRPDRIIVGEIRDGTIVDMLSAMSTGHEGSMSTVHANSPANLINSRMPILFSMYQSASFSETAQSRQISEAIQLIVHIGKMPSGQRKVTHITHVHGIDEKGRVNLNDIFLYNEETDEFEATGYVPKELVRRCKNRGITLSTDFAAKKEQGVIKSNANQ